MGSPDVRSFSRNKRGVAGSLVWINFDRHALLNVIRKAAGKFIANVDDVRPQFSLLASRPRGRRQAPAARRCRETPVRSCF